MPDCNSNEGLMLKSKWLIIALFALAYSYMFFIIPPPLIFLNTTMTGGDSGSHNYIVNHLKEIFPAVHGWSPDWYAGFPFMYFYSPLLYYLAVILSYLIPINVAFKLVTLLGTFMLPVCVYLCLKILKMKHPIPVIGMIFSLSFIFLEAYSIYGGNLPSTLSGEFSYSFSFALFWIFIATMKKGLEEKMHLLANTLLLSLMVLSHLIPVMLSLLIVPLFLFAADYKHRLIYLIKVYCLAFLLTSFWSAPFLWYLDLTSNIMWTRLIQLSDIFPKSLIPVQALALAGLVYSFAKKDTQIRPIIYAGAISLLPYLLIDNWKIWNNRFLPFFTMASLITGAYCLGNALNRTRLKYHMNILLPIVSILLVLWTNTNMTFIPHWVRWNYEGFEKKRTWNEIKPLFDYLGELPKGRVMWEFSPSYNRYGTSRVLEDIPLFSKQPTMEGLLIESSITSPFHFINQSETTRTPTHGVSGFEYPGFDMKKAVEHFRLCGIRYFIAYTEDTKSSARTLLPELKAIGKFAVFEIPDIKLVEPIKNFTIQKMGPDWLKSSIEWYKNGDLSSPIIFPYKTRTFKKPDEDQDIQCTVTRLTNDSIEFNTTGIGIPHMVKISYFPRWHVKGGEGPYRVSPSFMAVVPKTNHVRLTFR